MNDKDVINAAAVFLPPAAWSSLANDCLTPLRVGDLTLIVNMLVLRAQQDLGKVLEQVQLALVTPGTDLASLQALVNEAIIDHYIAKEDHENHR